MCTQNQAVSILHEVFSECGLIFGSSLRDGYLYGSYARGDYHAESDIDILLTVDLPSEAICRHRRAVAEMTSDLSLKHDITISIAIKEKQQFDKYADQLPYYQNVLKEGIRCGIS